MEAAKDMLVRNMTEAFSQQEDPVQTAIMTLNRLREVDPHPEKFPANQKVPTCQPQPDAGLWRHVQKQEASSASMIGGGSS